VAKRTLRPQSSGNVTIKNTAAARPLDGYLPAFSASGQEVWLPNALHRGPALVLSAVGPRCARTFKAAGEWRVVANTHILWPGAGQTPNYWWRWARPRTVQHTSITALQRCLAARTHTRARRPLPANPKPASRCRFPKQLVETFRKYAALSFHLLARFPRQEGPPQARNVESLPQFLRWRHHRPREKPLAASQAQSQELPA